MNDINKEAEKEEKINFDSLIEIYNKWIKRFEDNGLDWGEKDWINWGIDVSDAIIDIYHYLKSLGFLAHGLNELLYKPKEENEAETKKDDDDDIKRLYN